MVGIYFKWESSLSVEQLYDAIAQRVPHFLDAEYGMVHEKQKNGKIVFSEVGQSTRSPYVHIMTCWLSEGEGGRGSVVFASTSVLPFLATLAPLIAYLALRTGAAWSRAYPILLAIFIPMLLLLFFSRAVYRERAMKLLDDIANGSRTRCFKRRKTIQSR